jgi:hypothetical protein
VQEGKHPDNTAKLRITNNGLFPVQVDFVMQSRTPAASGDAKGKGGKDKAPAADKGGKGACTCHACRPAGLPTLVKAD